MTAVRETGFINSRPSLAECLTLLPPVAADNDDSRDDTGVPRKDFEMTSSASTSSQHDSFGETENQEATSSHQSNAISNPATGAEYSQAPDQCTMQHISPLPYLTSSRDATTPYHTVSPTFPPGSSASVPNTMLPRANSVPTRQESMTGMRTSPESSQYDEATIQPHARLNTEDHPYTGQSFQINKRISPRSHGVGVRRDDPLTMNGMKSYSEYPTGNSYFQGDPNHAMISLPNDSSQRFPVTNPCVTGPPEGRYGRPNEMQTNGGFNEGQIPPQPHPYCPIENPPPLPPAMHGDYPPYMNNRHPDYPWMRDKKMVKKPQEARSM